MSPTSLPFQTAEGFRAHAKAQMKLPGRSYRALGVAMSLNRKNAWQVVAGGREPTLSQAVAAAAYFRDAPMFFPPRDDAELVKLAEMFAALVEALTHTAQDTPQGVARAERLAAALQPICDRSRTLRATSLPGFKAKAVIAAYWAPTADHEDSDDLPWQMHASLVWDLMEAGR